MYCKKYFSIEKFFLFYLLDVVIDVVQIFDLSPPDIKTD